MRLLIKAHVERKQSMSNIKEAHVERKQNMSNIKEAH
jgi:hypothetical protein